MELKGSTDWNRLEVVKLEDFARAGSRQEQKAVGEVIPLVPGQGQGYIAKTEEADVDMGMVAVMEEGDVAGTLRCGSEVALREEDDKVQGFDFRNGRSPSRMHLHPYRDSHQSVSSRSDILPVLVLVPVWRDLSGDTVVGQRVVVVMVDVSVSEWVCASEVQKD